MKNYLKYKIIIILLLLPFLNLKSQESLRQKGWYFGFFLSPDCSYVTAPKNQGQATQEFYNDLIPIIAQTAGFDFTYQVSTSFAMRTGFYSSLKGCKTPIYENQYPTWGAGGTKGYNRFEHLFLEVPFNVEIYFSRRRIAPFLNIGAAGCIPILDRSAYIGYDFNGNYGKTKAGDLNCVPYLQLNLGAGIDISFHNLSRLKIFPLYRLTLIQSSGPHQGKLFSIGLGVNYCFKLSKKGKQ